MTTATSDQKLGDTLREHRKGAGLSIPALAAQIGVSKNTLGDYERSSRLPDADFLANFAQVTGASFAALAEIRAAEGGDGYFEAVLQEMGALVAQGAEERLGAYSANDEFAYVPRLNAEVCGGHGAEPPVVEARGEPHAFRQDWLRREGLQQDHLVVVTAVGDSMEPTVEEGDILLVETFESLQNGAVKAEEFREGPPAEGVYVVRVGSDLVVKRIQTSWSGEVYLMSDNPGYKTMTVPADRVGELDLIGRVVWVGRRI